jgi:hypothetical protein
MPANYQFSFGSVTTFICISICLCKYLNTLLHFAFEVLNLLIGQFEIKDIIVHTKCCGSLASADCSPEFAKFIVRSFVMEKDKMKSKKCRKNAYFVEDCV